MEIPNVSGQRVLLHASQVNCMLLFCVLDGFTKVIFTPELLGLSAIRNMNYWPDFHETLPNGEPIKFGPKWMHQLFGGGPSSSV